MEKTPEQQETEDLGIDRLYAAIVALHPEFVDWSFREVLFVQDTDKFDELIPPPGHIFIVVERGEEALVQRRLLTIPSLALRRCPVPPYPQNMITPEDVEREIEAETYQILPSGKGILCELTLLNGQVECGVAYVIDPHNFDFQKGKSSARAKAVNEVYKVLAWRKHEYVTKTSHPGFERYKKAGL